MKILDHKLSKSDWEMLAGTELGANMIMNSFSIILEDEELDLVYKCTDYLEDSATGLWYVGSAGTGLWSFYFNHSMDKANLLSILTSPVENL